MGFGKKSMEKVTGKPDFPMGFDGTFQRNFLPWFLPSIHLEARCWGLLRDFTSYLVISGDSPACLPAKHLDFSQQIA